MAGLISWQALGPDALHGPCGGSWRPPSRRPGPAQGQTAGPAAPLPVLWLLPPALGCWRQAQFFRLQSVSWALAHPGDPTEGPAQAALSTKGPSSGASSSQHDHSMAGALLRVWKPGGSILPNWA